MARVLILIPSMAGVGGTERMVAAIARLLSGRHDVAVAAFDPLGTVPHFDPGVPFHALGEDAFAPYWLRWRTYWRQARALATLQRRLGTEVTISNLWRADLINALARGGSRRIGLAHINVVGNPTNRIMLRLRPIIARIYRRFDRVIAVSAALADELTALYRLAPGRVGHIDNFVDVAVPRGIATRRMLLWCGRMVDEKNTALLIPIFACIASHDAEVELVLIGDGPLEPIVRDAAEQLGQRARIHLTGRTGDPIPVIAAASLMLLPSHSEGLPMVLLESLALGVPVVASDCPSGGVHGALGGRTLHDPDRSAAEETSCGVLLPVPRNVDDTARITLWAETVTELLADPLKLARLADGARRRAENYRPEAAVGRWNTVIDEVLSQ